VEDPFNGDIEAFELVIMQLQRMAKRVFKPGKRKYWRKDRRTKSGSIFISSYPGLPRTNPCLLGLELVSREKTTVEDAIQRQIECSTMAKANP
jgi:hypothetical protein